MSMSKHSYIRSFLLVTVFAFAAPALAADDAKKKAPAGEKPAAAEKCEHGVKKTVCTRCNPKLEAVFKSKGDWCAEHKRPETQCAICHSELEKQGVKK